MLTIKPPNSRSALLSLRSSSGKGYSHGIRCKRPMYGGRLRRRLGRMETGNLLVDAQTAFARQRRQRHRERAAGWLLRRRRVCGCLAGLEEALGAAPPASRRPVGVRTIPLSTIVGTAEPAKARAFDHRFRPATVDAMTRDQLYEDIKAIWRSSRKTIVFVTHNVREAVCLGDRVLLLSPSPGRVAQEFHIPLKRPRDINSVELASHASRIAAALKGAAAGTVSE